VPLRVCVAGVTGWAGRAVAEADDAADDLELVAGVSRSNQASLCGLSAADYQEIDARALQQQVGVIAAGNFSLTAALLLRFAAEAARHLASWEVIDYASAGKADAPSGTWRELAERLDAIRSPTVAVPV
jgi:dihydrodipicolinate reductase